MRCDKCGKVYRPLGWLAGSSDPVYRITEDCGWPELSEINLCRQCCRRLQKWLAETPEEEVKRDILRRCT